MQELFLKSGAGRVRAVDWLENDFEMECTTLFCQHNGFLGSP